MIRPLSGGGDPPAASPTQEALTQVYSPTARERALGMREVLLEAIARKMP